MGILTYSKIKTMKRTEKEHYPNGKRVKLEAIEKRKRELLYGDGEQRHAIKEKSTPVKFDGHIQDNYDKYLKESYMIGFTYSYPTKTILKTFDIETTCRGFDVKFKVHLAKGSFGKNNEFEVSILKTEKVSIAEHLFLNGWNSMCCYDEAETMEKAIVEICKKENLMICRKACSWPFATAVVQDNFYKD